MRKIDETYLFPDEPKARRYEAFVLRQYPALGYATKTNVRPATGLERGYRALEYALDVNRWNSCD